MSRTKLIVTSQGLTTEAKEMFFEDPVLLTIGRAKDCEVRLPADDLHGDVSRYHCVLELALPNLRVADLGSRNGTFVNGTNIGQRPTYSDDTPDTVAMSQPPSCALHDGDEVRLGSTSFQIHVADIDPREATVVLEFSSPI